MCGQDLIRLVAYDQQNVRLPMTTFAIVDNTDDVPFAIRLDHGRGVVYTTRALVAGRTHTVRVNARSRDHRRAGVVYETSFIIYIAVASFPY